MPKTIKTTNNSSDTNPQSPVNKPKRGRKSKIELMAALNMQIINETNIALDIEEKGTPNNIIEDLNEKPPLKKRGRKPKGGKIVQQVSLNKEITEDKYNVILHLKCSSQDMISYNTSDVQNYKPNPDLAYDFITNNQENDLIQSYYNPINDINDINGINDINAPHTSYSQEIICDENNTQTELKDVWKKLKQLDQNLHMNNIPDKNSACFWCTCDFDNPQIYIPKYYVNDSYQVYGCFCSPECAVASLMSENIDSSAKFERYHFLNHIYAKIFNYTKNIKPAPNPYYLLDKYYGNLTIQEYRSLLRNERLFIIVDKPLTRILPELHEDNDDFILNNKIIPSNNYKLKKRLQKNNKTNILNETFGLNN
jgi:hypothetical protein